MAEATKDGAAAGGLTLEQVNQAIAAALKPVTDALGPLAANQKVLADTMAADAKAKADAAAAEAIAGKKPEPFTQEQANSLIGDAIKKAFEQQTASQQSSAQRAAFIKDKLGNVPSAFAERLGNDPAKWNDEVARIGEDAKAEAKRLGWKIPDVSGGNPGGASPSDATSDQKITQYKASGLTDGQAEFAATLKLPSYGQ